jgi:hypothetical protein
LSYLRLGFPSDFFLPRFPTKTLHAPLPLWATCPSHLVFSHPDHISSHIAYMIDGLLYLIKLLIRITLPIKTSQPHSL